MPIHERKPEEKKRRRIVCSSGTSTGPGYTFAKKDEVPAGFYEAILDRVVDSKTSSNNDAIDVFYSLKDGNKRYKIVQRVAVGYYYDRFCEQLMAAGVKKGAFLDELDGVDVMVEVNYNHAGFAQITVLPSKSVANRMSLLLEDDEEDDDLLEEE